MMRCDLCQHECLVAGVPHICLMGHRTDFFDLKSGEWLFQKSKGILNKKDAQQAANEGKLVLICPDYKPAEEVGDYDA